MGKLMDNGIQLIENKDDKTAVANNGDSKNKDFILFKDMFFPCFSRKMHTHEIKKIAQKRGKTKSALK